MLKSELSFEELQLSSQLIRDFIAGKEAVSAFYGLPFDQDRILEQIQRKSFSDEKRQLLANTLRRQSESLKLSEASSRNLEALEKPNCFTVCTGHQLNLLSGPLYSIYKIAQTIVLSRQLAEKYPAHTFVPVFWMASEVLI